MADLPPPATGPGRVDDHEGHGHHAGDHGAHPYEPHGPASIPGPEAGHAPGHRHGPGHHHPVPDTLGRAFAVGIALNAGFILVEAVAATYGHSVALLADAGHNVSDVLGLVAAWLAQRLGRTAPTARFTYGLGSSSILAALLNAVLLLVVVGGLSLEALQRLAVPAPVEGGLVMAIATLGIVINGGTALLFFSGRHDDLNVRGAYLHMASDALVSLGVVVAGGLILATGWLWIDAVTSLLVNLVIVVGTWSLLRESLAMSLDAVPPGIEAEAVQGYLLGQTGVTALHDFHVWSMSTTETALSAHLVMPAGHPGDTFLTTAAADLRDRYRIGHMTLQIETSADAACPLAHGHARP